MEQIEIFKDLPKREENETNIGNGLSLKFDKEDPNIVKLYRNGVIIKKADFSDKAQKRIFVIETVELGAFKTYLASALGISRQTIHNYEEIKKYFGMEGLIHGYTPSVSKSLRKQRQIHSDKRSIGNKAEKVAEIRREIRKENEARQLHFQFDFSPLDEANKVAKEELPFKGEHKWEPSRYAGTFCYLTVLIIQFRWLELVMGFFGGDYRIFMIFAFMVSQDIRSIEQLKNVRSRESGILLGMNRLPSKPKIWELFYRAANKQLSHFLLEQFFRFQIFSGKVGLWLWFIDGHLLPYSGYEKIHYAYNTQRRIPVPGQTNMVTCDQNGRIVAFTVQEGKGDLRNHVIELAKKWRKELPMCPVMVFDREGTGVEFFSNMVLEKIPFVTWEKNVNTGELKALDDDLFKDSFEFNKKEYGVFEKPKSLIFKSEEGEDAEEHKFALRRIYIWNKKSNRRTCGLAWTGGYDMSTQDCATAILSRWGASENTFKHLKDRHPLHYQPGFKLVESENQEILNPEVKAKEGIITRIKKRLNVLYKKLTKSKESLKKDGTPRKNSSKEKIKTDISKLELELEQVMEEKQKLPEKIDVSTLEDYRSFKRIDNEGKNLFDFVTSSIWNARKQMVEWLIPYFDQENEVVDLFYAITKCQGWIKSTKKEVIVRLEPLEQPKRRLAQEHFCRKLNNLGALTPDGKAMVIEVGNRPENLK